MRDVIRRPEWDECRQIIEQELAQCRADLAPLESQQMRVGECMADGHWRDVTPAMIAAYRRSIRRLESLLVALQ
jgi:hypothetical protein